MESQEIGHVIFGLKPGDAFYVGDAKVVITSNAPVRVDVWAAKDIPVDRESVRERKEAA